MIYQRTLRAQRNLMLDTDSVLSNRENYIHRIGRSGRFGRKGVAINVREAVCCILNLLSHCVFFQFVTVDDVRILRDIGEKPACLLISRTDLSFNRAILQHADSESDYVPASDFLSPANGTKQRTKCPSTPRN